MNYWDRETDVLVFGSGAAGMTAALVSACEGLDVVLCEKADRVGGTTAVSGGTVWAPGNRHAREAGISDTLDDARRYLESEIGPDTRGLREAFLGAAASAIDYLEQHTDVRFRVPTLYPDYHPLLAGAALAGRSIQPVPFDARVLGERFTLLREPRPGFTILGGMMVNRDEAALLLRPFASWRAFAFTTRALVRHARDRLRFARGTRLLIGNALAGRFLSTLLRSPVRLEVRARLVRLVVAEGRVAGALVEIDGASVAIGARCGVVLATGGFAASAEWRAQLMEDTPASEVLADAGATGDGIRAALRAGARLETFTGRAALWMPASVLRRPGKPDLAFPHVIMDRARPGLIAVDAAGRRFVNEGDSYHDFVTAMFRANCTAPAIPAFLICDRVFVRRYGIGLVRPLWQWLRPFVSARYLIRGRTLRELAERAGIDAAGLEDTVARHNRDSVAGVDTEFGKGGNALNRMYGDPRVKPNPCLAPIVTPPFFAVAVYPAVLGTSAGLATDADGRVLDVDDRPIAGLHACGNDQCSIMQGHYPGAGITLGPAIVFGYRAAMFIARTRRAAAAHTATPLEGRGIAPPRQRSDGIHDPDADQKLQKG